MYVETSYNSLTFNFSLNTENLKLQTAREKLTHNTDMLSSYNGVIVNTSLFIWSQMLLLFDAENISWLFLTVTIV